MRTAPVAQARPNFSGAWQLVTDPPAPLRPGAPPDLRITQTTTLFTTEEPARDGTVSVTYKLDGTESRQNVNRVEIVTRATWDGDRLVTSVSGQSANWKDVWTLTGDRLTVETTVPGRTQGSTRRYVKVVV